MTNGHGRVIASLVHAALVGAAGAGAYLLAKQEGPVWIGLAIFVSSRVAGAVCNVLFRPRRRRRQIMPGAHQVDGLQQDVRDRLGRVVTFLAVLQAECDYLAKAARQMVDDVTTEEE